MTDDAKLLILISCFQWKFKLSTDDDEDDDDDDDGHSNVMRFALCLFCLQPTAEGPSNYLSFCSSSSGHIVYLFLWYTSRVQQRGTQLGYTSWVGTILV